MDVKCKHCDRYLFKATGTVILEDMPCPNSKCKAKLNYKIVRNSETSVFHKFTYKETPPKKQKALDD